jgi:hypothetical protein
MRRFLISTAALSFLGAVLGCSHTAGVCDCGTGCCGGGGAAPLNMTGSPALKPEPIMMPKENAKPAELPAKPAEPMLEQ